MPRRKVLVTRGAGKTTVLVNSIARLIDIAGSTAPISFMSEIEATEIDWREVGDDFREAIGEFEAENKANLSLPFDELVETS